MIAPKVPTSKLGIFSFFYQTISNDWFFFSFSFQSLSALTEKEPVQNQPIWGQFHFIPNGSISIGTNYLVQTPYNTSYTTLGTVSALYNSGALDPPQAPVVLMPSSYDLSPKENDNDDRCFTLILISGSLVLLATVVLAAVLSHLQEYFPEESCVFWLQYPAIVGWSYWPKRVL